MRLVVACITLACSFFAYCLTDSDFWMEVTFILCGLLVTCADSLL